jgi:hypothetical protein
LSYIEIIMRNNLRFSAIAMAATVAIFAGHAYAADVTTTGDLDKADKWYGRAGGLIGADHVKRVTAGTRVGVTYDADVAARTNMSHREGGTESLGVSYDATVAERTNMLSRESLAPVVKAQPIVGEKIN